MVEYFPPGPMVMAPDGGVFIDFPVEAGADVVALVVVVAGVVVALVVVVPGVVAGLEVVGAAVVAPVPGRHWE